MAKLTNGKHTFLYGLFAKNGVEVQQWFVDFITEKRVKYGMEGISVI